MNQSTIFKTLMGFLVAGGAIATPTQMDAVSPVEECSKELLLSYFPEPFVRESLKKYNIPEDKWDAIVKELNAKDKDVVKMVEEKAGKLNPNPLKDPQQRQAAVKIFRDTLTDVFSTTLKKNGITDENQILQVLDDVQQQKAKRFAQCMEQQRSKPVQTNSSNVGQPQASADLKAPPTQPKSAAPNEPDPWDTEEDL